MIKSFIIRNIKVLGLEILLIPLILLYFPICFIDNIIDCFRKEKKYDY